jgi:hypothetical protein
MALAQDRDDICVVPLGSATTALVRVETQPNSKCRCKWVDNRFKESKYDLHGANMIHP